MRRGVKSCVPLCVPLWLLFAAPWPLSAQFTTHLAPATDQAFEQYRTVAESKMDWKARFAAKPGEVTIAPFGREGSLPVKDGLIHDWAAATIARGATVEQVLGVLQDYANYKTTYAPDVAGSRLLSREGKSFRVWLRLVKKALVPVEFDTEYEVEYRALGAGRWAMVSRSTKVAELDGARELSPGTGTGFLWRLNAYWLIEPRADGAYLECRSISLSRDIPLGLAWAIKPVVANLPSESLRTTLESTVRGLR